jgi:hypothetical protein
MREKERGKKKEKAQKYRGLVVIVHTSHLPMKHAESICEKPATALGRQAKTRRMIGRLGELTRRQIAAL